MPTATTTECANALIRGWISQFGLPRTAGSDNGVQFVSQVWQKLQEELGTIVAYSPFYSSQSLGAVERQHRDLKQSLRATLMAMAETHQSRWMSVLPWTLLSRRTAYHSELQASPAEVVYGTQLRVPGDLHAGDLTPDHGLPQLLDRLRENARRPPAQTGLRREPKVYYPPTTLTATHIYLRRQKTTPLSPRSDGPYRILKRVGKSVVQIITGEYKNGNKRTEMHHWKNCHPMILPDDTIDAHKLTLDRKPTHI